MIIIYNYYYQTLQHHPIRLSFRTQFTRQSPFNDNHDLLSSTWRSMGFNALLVQLKMKRSSVTKEHEKFGIHLILLLNLCTLITEFSPRKTRLGGVMSAQLKVLQQTERSARFFVSGVRLQLVLGLCNAL